MANCQPFCSRAAQKRAGHDEKPAKTQTRTNTLYMHTLKHTTTCLNDHANISSASATLLRLNDKSAHTCVNTRARTPAQPHHKRLRCNKRLPIALRAAGLHRASRNCNPQLQRYCNSCKQCCRNRQEGRHLHALQPPRQLLPQLRLPEAIQVTVWRLP